jgi:signal transduction histidine kinase
MDSVQRQEAQSRQLARELHDELGQMLYAIKLDALAAAGARQRAAARAHLDAIGAHVDQLQTVVRAMLQRLRPVGLDELGLTAALEACVQGWRMRLPHVHLTLALDDGHDGLDGLDEATNITLYRVIQESLTNCARHARATRIDIGIAAHAPSGATGGGGLVLTVQDDGIGSAGDPAVPAGHAGFGLLGMRERVEALGGAFSAGSSAAPARGPGFRVEACLPYVKRRDGTAAMAAANPPEAR